MLKFIFRFFFYRKPLDKRLEETRTKIKESENKLVSLQKAKDSSEALKNETGPKVADLKKQEEELTKKLEQVTKERIETEEMYDTYTANHSSAVYSLKATKTNLETHKQNKAHLKKMVENNQSIERIDGEIQGHYTAIEKLEEKSNGLTIENKALKKKVVKVRS